MSRPSEAPVHHRITACRACLGETLEEVLDLGAQPLANALPTDPAGLRPSSAFRWCSSSADAADWSSSST